MSTVLKVENLSKLYQLGIVGTGTISHDLNRWWHRMRGNEDPYSKIGETNVRDQKGNSDFVWALRDINFEVTEGEVLGIIGKNGAGKSTLLKILSRTTLPTTGDVKIKGRVASLLEVGTGFHPELTGRENIYLNGALLGMKKKEITGKLDEIIAFSGVERYIDTPVKRYSSGMYVRLAFAVAAHLDSEILIFDEVLAVGDAEFQRKCLGKMGDISKGDGRTVLFVSHNMEAVKNLCSKGIVLLNGNKEFEGTSDNAVLMYINSNKNQIMQTKLKHRTDRSGEGNIIIDDVWLEDLNHNHILSAVCGEKLFIKLLLNKTKFSKPLYCSIIIKDIKGLRVWTLSSEMQNKKAQIGDNGIVVFEIDKMPLSENEYMCDIRLACQNDAEIQDWIKDAFLLKVIGTDYFKTGQAQSANLDVFFNSFRYYSE